jgi:hypothetical protein
VSDQPRRDSQCGLSARPRACPCASSAGCKDRCKAKGFIWGNTLDSYHLMSVSHQRRPLKVPAMMNVFSLVSFAALLYLSTSA